MRAVLRHWDMPYAVSVYDLTEFCGVDAHEEYRQDAAHDIPDVEICL